MRRSPVNFREFFQEFTDTAINTPITLLPGDVDQESEAESDYYLHWPNVALDDSDFWLRLMPDPDTEVEKHGVKGEPGYELFFHPGTGGTTKELKNALNAYQRKHGDKPDDKTLKSMKSKMQRHEKVSREKSIRRVTRADDKRKSQGQTPTGLIDHRTGKPLSKSGAGDAGEALFVSLGAKHVAKFLDVDGFEQQAGSAKLRNTPLDIIIGMKAKKGRFRRFAAEVKSVSSTSSGGKPKASIKAAEHERKMAAIDDDDIRNPNLPRAIPLLVGQVITLNPDGSGTAKIVIHEGDYPSRGYHLMEEVITIKFTADQWAAAIDQGTINRKRKGLKKAADDDELEAGDWYIDFGKKPPRVYAVDKVNKSADERIAEPNLKKRLSGDFRYRELVQPDEE